MKPFVLGTRGSDLALAQTRFVAAALRSAHPGLVLDEKIIRTTGDQRLDVSLSAPGPLDKGLFTKELEDALLAGEIDAAVHSLKDLPVEQPAGLCLAAILEREDPSDVLVSRFQGGLEALPEGSVVATGSLRRRCFIQWRRPGLILAEIRGNVPTRLRKLAASTDLSAIVLAAAGLRRLQAAGVSLPVEALHVTPLPFMLPAPGQGAVAVECRQGDGSIRSLLASIHDAPTAASVDAEREVLSGLGGGCHMPLGARASVRNDELSLSAVWFPEGSAPREARVSGPATAAHQIAQRVVAQLSARP